MLRASPWPAIAPAGISPWSRLCAIRVNGQESTRNYLKHADLLQGGTIEFKMGSHPNLNRGINDDDAPYSFSKMK